MENLDAHSKGSEKRFHDKATSEKALMEELAVEDLHISYLSGFEAIYLVGLIQEAGGDKELFYIKISPTFNPDSPYSVSIKAHNENTVIILRKKMEYVIKRYWIVG